MTAVIAKYEIEFNKWVEANPLYPEPVWIGSEWDINEEHQYHFIVKAPTYHKVFNYKKVYKQLQSQCIRVIAIVGTDLKELKAYQHNNPNKVYKLIMSIRMARMFVYSEVILSESAKEIKDGKAVFVECTDRYAPKPCSEDE